jgi:hypothetical protein
MIKVMRRWLALPVMATVVAAIGVFGLPASPAMASGPCTFPTGGTWFGVTCWNSTYPLVDESEEYAVPADPSSTGESTFSLWGGLQDAVGDTVLQNVLYWNGYSWSAYPEYYWGLTSPKPQNKNWTPISANPGDTLTSTIDSVSCDGAGQCTWLLTVEDLNSGESSTSALIGSDAVFTQLLGGVFEDHTASGCASLPANDHVAFRQISAKNNQVLNVVSPQFAGSTPDHQCSMVVASSPTSTDFTWQG